MKRLHAILLICLLAAPVLADWKGKVDSRLLQTQTQGETEFLVVLTDKADLTGARKLKTKNEKGEHVFKHLTETATRAQGPLLKHLHSRNLKHQTFWIANVVLVHGTISDIQTIAHRPEVSRIIANTAFQIKPAEISTTAATAATAATASIQWNISKVRAPEVWALGYTGQGVVIGGQDTGYRWNDPALVYQYRGWDGTNANHNYNWHDAIHTSSGNSCGTNLLAPCDDYGHGTATMVTMAGYDGTNHTGMAPGARWMGCRNMDNGRGTPATYLECFQWFLAPTDLNDQNPDPTKAPDVINNSWYSNATEGTTNLFVFQQTVETLRTAGIVVVCCAGNSGSGCSTIVSPAFYDASFTVGATDANDNIASFSSRGPVTIDGSNRIKPDVVAPGVNVIGGNGTSFSAPHVVGLIALLLSAHPELKGNVDLIEYIIEHSAVPLTNATDCAGLSANAIPNNTYGWGRIDAYAAVAFTNPTIVAQPVSSAYNPGTTAVFTVLATSSAPLNYQWNKNGNPLTDVGNISGSTNAVLTLSNLQFSDAGNYSVVITNVCGSVTSSVASLMIIDDPLIVSQPASRTNAVDTAATFIVMVSGTQPLSYQWRFNGTNIFGATNVTLTLSSVQFSAAGSYSVLVSNLYGTIISTAATLSVLPPQPLPSNPRPGNFAINVPANTNLAWSAATGNNELVLNGGFESGSLTNWTVMPTGPSTFIFNNGTVDPPSPDEPLPPFAGIYSALGAAAGPAAFYMYQTISIPANVPSVNLSWEHRVRNFYDSFSPSQQFQVRICDVNNNALATPFTTKPGDPLLDDWVQNDYDMTAYAGQTVRVEYWINTQQYYMDAHVDNVSVKIAGPTGAITNDVYFGTNPVPGPADFQGSTTNTSWILPLLAPQTTYYWQIVAHNGGTSTGPVWQFRTGDAVLQPPQSFRGHAVGGGGLQLQFSGTPNYPYILQTVTNLTPPVSWQSILTNPADANGNWSITVTNSSGAPAGYFRAVGQ